MPSALHGDSRDHPLRSSVARRSKQAAVTFALGDCSLMASSRNWLGSDAYIAKPHKGGANFAFFDGHVEYLKPIPVYTNGMLRRTGGV